jgi:hypothetical protein
VDSEVLEQYFFKQSPGILSTDLSGESVIMDLLSGKYSSFNAVGSIIWNELKEERRFFQILESIMANFDVERKIAQDELAEFLDLLLEKNLITAQKTTEQI